MIAEIIAVGSEMLTPHRQDTNSLYLTAGLNDLGVAVAFKTIVGDNPAHLTSALRIALSRADLVLLSGGLGPTEDDLTRECVAEVLERKLLTDQEILLGLRKRFAARKLPMPPNNARQSQVIAGAEVLPNANGSAHGQFLDCAIQGDDGEPYRKLVLLLPGPPRELKPLFDDHCRPRLAALLPPAHLARRVLRMALLPESQVDARTAPIYAQFDDVETTILAGNAEIQLHFLCAKPTREEAEARVEAVADLCAREMHDDIFSTQNESLEEVVLLMMEMRGLTLSTAESCTGGLLSERLTRVPNSSRVFVGGAVCYSGQAKIAFAGVLPDDLTTHGAVSDPIARQLAEGIRARTHTALGISITGIAGPSAPAGADAGKPVGLVYIGLTDGEDTQVRQLHLQGDRDRIRLFATQHALEMIRRALL